MEQQQLHLFFLPFMAAGHMLPMLDMANLFASRGVRTSILTTPSHAHLVQPAIVDPQSTGNLHLLLLRVPTTASAISPAVDLASLATYQERIRFIASLPALRPSFEDLIRDHRPDAVVSDMFFPWTTAAAAEFGVPRLVFHGMSLFSLCATDSLLRHRPYENAKVDSNDVPFVLPGLPHRIEMQRTQLMDPAKMDPLFLQIFDEIWEAELRAFGVVVNSFSELEPGYADYFREIMGRKAWYVGPVSLCNKDPSDKALVDAHDRCLTWLDSQELRSVVYLCFGSTCNFSAAQLREIALGLEASPHPFLWVVKDDGGGHQPEWLPEGLAVRLHEGKGLMAPGWVPQRAILKHGAVGAFVTHCGWNSCLEGVAAAVPMVAWPLYAEQFLNERQLVDVLGVAVSVGFRHYSYGGEDRMVLKGEELRKAVGRVMERGEEAEGLRRRAREIGKMAERAVAAGGSSYIDLDRLIEDLRRNRGGGKGVGEVDQ